MSQSVPEPEPEDAYEAWRDLQDVLEERDAEYWDEHGADDDR